MIRTQLVLCASRVIRDSELNRVSAIDLLEEVATPGFPVIIPRLVMLWVLERDDEDGQQFPGAMRLYLNDNQLQEFPIEINFQQSLRARSIVEIRGMPIQAPGRLKVAFLRQGVEEATYFISVNAVPQADGVAQPAGVVNVSM